MVNVAEAVRDPQPNLPRAILWSIAVSTLLYLAIAIVAVVSVPRAQLAATDAPLALIYQTLTGRTPNLAKAISYALLLVFAPANPAEWHLKQQARPPEGRTDIPR